MSRSRATRRVWATLLAVVLALSACSSASDDPSFGGEGDDGRRRNRNQARRERTRESRATPKPGEIKKLASAAPTAAPGKAVTAPVPTPVDTSDYGVGQEYTRGRSAFDDGDADATKQGLTPLYAEMTEASVEGLGQNFRLTISLSGNPPDRMPDDKTFMIVAFGMRGREDSATFGAQATDDGWKPYAGKSQSKSNRRNRFPGDFAIEGNDIVMTVPWSYLGGGMEFEWIATSAWFASVADTTHYAYDTAPNDGNTQRYPQ